MANLPLLDAVEGDNVFMIGVVGDKVVSLKLRIEFTKAEALNLAAWLVTLADTKDEFGLYLEKVQS